MRLLGLDIGMKRTGVAYFEDDTGIVLPVTTLSTSSDEETIEKILELATVRKVDRLVIGIPRLPSGEEGAQAQHVRSIATTLESRFAVTYVDERYSSVPLREKGGKRTQKSDSDTWAACQILTVYTEQN